ncbi:sugar ABC transporter ATP-binding protein [Actinoallomurus sp. NPDC052308]|uniref:sugar ABC transporter ATP-binding protein n=1 Tax=Actinoallomurus sp. NPDC052308 TaxID=3155530 RepID=UPI00343203F2
MGVRPVVSVCGLAKRYGATWALRDVDLEIAPGEVLGLIGTNGAGKSTLIKILSGVTRPTGGEIRIDGTLVDLPDPLRAQEAGLQTVHQDIDAGVVSGADVAENLTLDALVPGRSGVFVTRGRTRVAARAIAEAARLDVPLDAPVESLPAGARQHIVIARVLSRRPRVLILDEPTSALSAAEIRVLVSMVRRLAAEGVAVLYVSHRLSEIKELCDRVAVLRDGAIRRVFARPVEGHRLVEAMLGGEVGALTHEVREGGEPVLRATGLRTRPGVEPLDLTVRAGEVVGVTGLVGSGKTELLEQLYGARPLVSGTLDLDGRPYRPRDPGAAAAAGVAFVAEEREAQAVLPGWSVRAHVTLPRLRDHSRIGLLSRRSESAAARRVIEAFGVRGPGPEAEIGALSGGNQQKVVVGRWLEGRCRLVLLDEPFRGVDVGARADIARRIRERAGALGVVIASSDPQEVLQVADRVIVLHDGVRTGEVSAADASAERLATLMAGGADEGGDT